MSAYVVGLVPRIRQILKGSDLSTVSAKAVRKQLVTDGEEPAAIKEYRGEIDERIGEIYEELAGGSDGESEDENDKPLASNSNSRAPHSSGHAPPSSQPEPLVERKPKPKKPASKGGDQVESDAAMAARMQAEYDAATRGARGSRRAAAPTPKKKTKKDKVKKRSASDVEDSDASDGKPKKKRGGGGGAFNKELILSDALGAFLHEQRLSRPQTVKRIWDYVKANDLQDPSDRRFILCDAVMQTVFHTDKLHMFTMNKLLAQHFRDPDEVV